MDEMWKPVVGSEKYYEISNMGRIRSRDYIITTSDFKRRKIKGKILETVIAKRGNYRTIRIRTNENVYSTRKIHLLVLEAFVGPRPNGLLTRHLDNNPQNNKLDNICYGTFQENEQDKISAEHHHQINKDKCPLGHLLEEPNLRESTQNEGYRGCKACNRATSIVSHNLKKGIVLSKKEIADQKYKEIMNL